MHRRELFGIFAVSSLMPSVFGADHCGADELSPVSPTHSFFTSEERSLFDAISELIIPSDEHSPGANAAGVTAFADLMLSNADPIQQSRWHAGLELIRHLSADSSVAQVIEFAASYEEDAGNELGQFFRKLKNITVDGYYTSSIGIHKDLQYRGNEYLLEFPRCDHPDHE